MEIKTFIFISAILTAYLVIGGFLFQFLEQLDAGQLLRITNASAIVTGNISEWTDVDSKLMNALLREAIDGATNLTNARFDVEIVNISSTVNSFNDTNFYLNATIIDRLPDYWNLYNSIFYAETLLATVGFGYIYTKTVAGKLVACLYATIGIPLLGVWMNCVRENMLGLVKTIRKRLKINTVHKKLVLYVEVIVMILLGCAVFILCPAALFSYMEDWTYIAAFYFSVMSLTTIGLGDLVVGETDGVPGWYRVYINLWLLFGLGWLSLIISMSITIFRAHATKAVLSVASMAKAKTRVRRQSFTGVRNISVIQTEMAGKSFGDRRETPREAIQRRSSQRLAAASHLDAFAKSVKLRDRRSSSMNDVSAAGQEAESKQPKVIQKKFSVPHALFVSKDHFSPQPAEITEARHFREPESDTISEISSTIDGCNGFSVGGTPILPSQHMPFFKFPSHITVSTVREENEEKDD